MFNPTLFHFISFKCIVSHSFSLCPQCELILHFYIKKLVACRARNFNGWFSEARTWALSGQTRLESHISYWKSLNIYIWKIADVSLTSLSPVYATRWRKSTSLSRFTKDVAIAADMRVNLTSPFAKENSVIVREILLVSNILRMSPASTAELCVNLTSLAAF